MYKIAIIVNENEVAHSVFADTVSLLEDIVKNDNNMRGQYQLCSYDKYNIEELFEKDGRELKTFDSLIIATNATNNKEILDKLCNEKNAIEQFINLKKGVLILSQKKLSNKVRGTVDEKMITFLPEKYQYSLYDRPEKSSADGTVSIQTHDEAILNYPNHINEKLIENHCVKNNFMKHSYRSYIVPYRDAEYVPVLIDYLSPVIRLDNTNYRHRNLLMKSRSVVDRVVVSSMALDWASHIELLHNLLIFITSGSSQFAFIRGDKSNNLNATIFNSYILRAKISKISYRVFEASDVDEILNSPVNTFVFSANCSIEHVNFLWKKMAEAKSKHMNIYHLSDNQLNSDKLEFKLYQYSNYNSLHKMKLSASNWFAASFLPNLWGKSIWSYSYILLMMKETGIDYSTYIKPVYGELLDHIVKKNQVIDSYDGVINATCKLVELLHCVFNDDNYFKEVVSKYEALPSNVEKLCIQWLESKLFNPETSKHNKLSILTVLIKIENTCLNEKIKVDDIDDLNHIIFNTVVEYEENLDSCSNIELCDLLLLLCCIDLNGNSKYEVEKENINNMIAVIINILLKSQSINGEWKNISETSEILIYLFSIIDFIDSEVLINSVNVAIMNAVEYIYNKYDNSTGTWQNDYNSTSKSIHALELYDKYFNYSANDFFNYIQLNNQNNFENLFQERNLNSLNKYSEMFYKQEMDIKKSEEEAIDAKKKLKYTQSKLKRFKIYSFFSSIVALSILFIFSLVMIILFTNYNEIALEIVGNWSSYLISGFISIILSLIFMGLYQLIKRGVFGGGDS